MASEARDFRSDSQDRKRAKDHDHKWANGVRPSGGVWFDYPQQVWSGSEEQQQKVRPGRPRNHVHSAHGNLNKAKYRRHEDGHPMVQGKIGAMSELKDSSNMTRSFTDQLPPFYSRQMKNASDDFIYSFDKKESPGKPLSLEIFVKTNTKETEKIVEKEYEILDYNGDAVKGRKALKDLHRGKLVPAPVEESEPVEEDGFELV
ncbi:hypothetical protein GGS20DRAFT_286863 [Poronia punctata]|nr:hypothetical protein GGS20DRAFT_286863 [Poronia punctata]